MPNGSIPASENGLSGYFKTIGDKAAIAVAALTVRGPITRVIVFGLLYGMNEVELIHLTWGDAEFASFLFYLRHGYGCCFLCFGLYLCS